MLRYKKASLADIDFLTRTRLIVLRAANGLPEDADLSEVERQTYAYYQTALRDHTHTAYLVFDEDAFVGAGGISYFQVMPTCHNPVGSKAYIMNMYTAPAYRRRGIALETLRLLTEDAHTRGVRMISLEATEAGRPLYERFGFVPMKQEMELPETE